MKKLLWLLFFVSSLFNPLPCSASNNKAVTVSASVPDEIPPSAPVLIAPANGLYTSNQTPTFVFKKSTDAQSPVRHYEMYLNGSLFIPEIPSSQTPVQTSQFYCFITNDNISVSLKQPLDDGLYSWKIRAYDMYHNWIDSAQWVFTIDTQAPLIIINQVGENKNLNLSSQDPNSIPSNLKLISYQLQPEFHGLSEPGARIQINLTPVIEMQPSPAVGDSKGKFILKPKEKLKIGKYKVLVIASDAAGNTTVLPEFYLEIKRPLGPAVWPSLPPKIFNKPETLLQLPQPTLVPSPLEISLFYLTLALIILWLISSKIGFGFSWRLTPSFLRLFLIPPFFERKKRCLVYNDKNKKGVSFSQITIINLIKEKEIKEILANAKGKFNLKLAKGKYQIKTEQAGFISSIVNLKMEQAGSLDICLKLSPDIKNYRKYRFIRVLGIIFLWLGLISAFSGLIFWPNVVNLIVFIFCLDLIISPR